MAESREIDDEDCCFDDDMMDEGVATSSQEIFLYK